MTREEKETLAWVAGYLAGLEAAGVLAGSNVQKAIETLKRAALYEGPDKH